MSTPEHAPVITSDTPGSFAHGVLSRRHPALIQRVRDAFPYPPSVHRALAALRDEAASGRIEPLGLDAPDHADWQVWGRDCFGRSWYEVPFLWAESYFYRRLLGAVGYFEPGPWQGIDPFAPFKQAELTGDEVEGELASLDGLVERSEEEQARALLLGSLWGNRADLGFLMSSEGGSAADTHLVADESAALWSLLRDGAPGTVGLVADNAGRELIPDLVLLDHLLGRGYAEAAVLYVKPSPYYVSDAVNADVLDCLRRLGRGSGRAGEIGRALWTAMGEGRLTVRTHAFFCAPLTYRDLPEDLRSDFAGHRVTILKGDLNYRRLVGDRLWDPTVPFADLTGYFPGPVAALRTLKCDVVAGLDERTLTALDAAGGPWRTGGTHAVIQTKRS